MWERTDSDSGVTTRENAPAPASTPAGALLLASHVCRRFEFRRPRPLGRRLRSLWKRARLRREGLGRCRDCFRLGLSDLRRLSTIEDVATSAAADSGASSCAVALTGTGASPTLTTGSAGDTGTTTSPFLPLVPAAPRQPRHQGWLRIAPSPILRRPNWASGLSARHFRQVSEMSTSLPSASYTADLRRLRGPRGWPPSALAPWPARGPSSA